MTVSTPLAVLCRGALELTYPRNFPFSLPVPAFLDFFLKHGPSHEGPSRDSRKERVEVNERHNRSRFRLFPPPPSFLKPDRGGPSVESFDLLLLVAQPRR